jgi:hypothetical protein
MIDTARCCLFVHQLQNAADSAALAGARVVKHPGNMARQNAINTAGQNFAAREAVLVVDNPSNDPNGDVVVGRWIWQASTFIPTTDSPNAIKVVARRTMAHRQPGGGGGGPVSLVFGPIVKAFTADLARDAIAQSRGSLGAGIIVLDDNPDWTHAPTGLWMHGTGLIDVQGGDIQVNSVASGGGSPWQAMRMNGSLTVKASTFNVVGSTNPDPLDPGAWETFWADPTSPPTVIPNSSRIDDPLLALNPPVIPSGIAAHSSPQHQFVDTITQDTIAKLGETSPDNPNLKILELTPGYYPGGISITSGNGSVLVGQEPNPDPNLPPIPVYETYEVELVLKGGATVESSLYAFGGGEKGTSGLNIQGGTFRGEYVTVYVTGAHNGYDVEYGVIDVGGNAYVNITPPGDNSLFYEEDPITGEMGPAINGQPGISIWQDFKNPNDARIIGTGDFDLTGTLYFPNNHTEIGGTSFQAGNQLLTGSLDLHGTGVLGIAYDGRNFIEGWQSYLVH